MSDEVSIRLITMIGSVLGAALGVISTYIAYKTATRMGNVEKHTNSMKDELVKVTGEHQYLKGRAEEQQDSRQRGLDDDEREQKQEQHEQEEQERRKAVKRVAKKT